MPRGLRSTRGPCCSRRAGSCRRRTTGERSRIASRSALRRPGRGFVPKALTGVVPGRRHRGQRPGVWAPGDMVVFDCGEIGPLYVFCAVVAWSRVRFVSFADNLGAEVAMTALAECFECVGGVPKTALTDRSCLNGGTVAGLVIPTPANVRFATHYRFRPDFCEGADPESKDLVEKLVGYVESDLMIPEQLTVSHLGTANAKGRLWLDEVNGAVHSEISADSGRTPGQRTGALLGVADAAGHHRQGRHPQGGPVELCPARLGPLFGARCPRRWHRRVADQRRVVTVVSGRDTIAEDLVLSPGETSVIDDHDGGPRPCPLRAIRGPECRREGLLFSRPGGHSCRSWRPFTAGTGDRRSGAGRRLRPLPGGRRGLHPGGRPRWSPSHPQWRGPYRGAAGCPAALVVGLRHR